MDPLTEKESDFIVDLESGNRTTNLENMTIDPNSADGGFIIFENGAAIIGNISNVVCKEVEGENTIDLMDKSRRKILSAKKPPRPPRPVSLDAADQKLIRELAELAVMKRARIERMKAMKKMKVSKGSASYGNLLAMIFTIIFCLVIVFQGVCPGRSSAVNFQGSPESTETSNARLILLHYRMNKPARDATNDRLVERASSLQIGNEGSRSAQ